MRRPLVAISCAVGLLALAATLVRVGSAQAPSDPTVIQGRNAGSVVYTNSGFVPMNFTGGGCTPSNVSGVLTINCPNVTTGTISANNGSVNTVAGYSAAGGSTTIGPFAGLSFASNNLQIPSGGVYQVSTDVGLSRGAAGLFDVGTGAAASTAGFVKTAQTIAITGANFTCGTGGTSDPCTAAVTVPGLSVALPLVVANWSYTCDIIYSQATANATDGMGVQTAVNASTNLSFLGSVYQSTVASVNSSIVGVSSTTAQTLSITPTAAVGTKLNAHFAGTIEGTSVLGTTFNIVAFTGAAADLLTVYRGSSCYLY